MNLIPKIYTDLLVYRLAINTPMRYVLIIIALLAIQACTFKIQNCEVEPGAEVKDIQKDKPIQDQVTPKAEVKCNF